MTYELNVGRFIEDHPGLKVEAGPGGIGFRAWRRSKRGRPIGEPVTALTLDELHTLTVSGPNAQIRSRKAL